MEYRRTYKMKKINIIVFSALVLLCLTAAPKERASAASAVSIGRIDYDKLTMQVFNNNNTIVYYSTDNNNWSEVEGAYDSVTKSYEMDISWINSAYDVTLYFKGDLVKTVKSLVIPKQNSEFTVNYDRVEGTLSFENAEEANTFEWRKTTDYLWNSVAMEEASNSYDRFMKQIDYFQVTGASIILRLPQVKGSGLNDTGLRPSREITVSIIPRASAPTLTVNSSKLTMNTTTAMEYYDPIQDLWLECSSSMSLYDMAPEVLYENGGKKVILTIRRAATASIPYSKSALVTIQGQTAPPRIGDSSADVTYYYMNQKLMLQFNHASEVDIYEYIIVRPGTDYNIASSSWKTVKSKNLITLSNAAAPEGCTIYVRKKGTDANAEKGTILVLSSAVNSFEVDY